MAQLSRFEELALPYRDAAYNLAYWIVRHPDDAEDVVQDAYLRAFRAFPGFRGGEMRPWLLAIVRNSAFRLLKERKRAYDLAPIDGNDDGSWRAGHNDVASNEPTAEEKMLGEANAQHVRAALAELPLAYRDVIVLREMESLSYGEIAEITGVALGTVMSRLSRGRALLRKAVKKQEA
jgi:RNA polymerase sigma-70 factor (ECF subfamily)